LEPDTWMNDIGEKIPNWFESARLYYAYSGDASVMAIVKGLVDHTVEHGYWTDGHTDTNVNSNTYKSNPSASNAKLYLLDHPEFNPDWRTDIPGLIRWTEENFVFGCAPGEPATQWGANIVGEQEGFLPKMDYQTARQAAECARWNAVSGDAGRKA